MKINLFVYGTLKRKFHNNRLLVDQQFIGEATTWNNYVMRREGIPFVYKSSQAYCGDDVIEGSQINGELYSVDDEALSRIDRLEGHPSWYCRDVVNIYLHKKDGMWSGQAWLYFMKLEKEKDGIPQFSKSTNLIDCYV